MLGVECVNASHRHTFPQMAVHSGLSGKLLPVHLNPKEDELLSSWLVRLSLAHGLTPREFGNMIRPGYSTHLWNLMDIDLLHYVEILTSLSERCGVPLTRVRGTTLSEFERNLHTKLLTSRKPSYWIMDYDIRPTIPIAPCGLQACPRCLNEDMEPYMRRVWRLPFVVACPEHESLLIDRCPDCASAIHIHRNAEELEADTDILTVCYKCKSDLRDATTQPLAEAEAVVFQQKLVAAARHGYLQMEDSDRYSSQACFTLLYRMLTALLQLHPACGRLQRVISRHYGLTLQTFISTERHSFRSLGVRRRYQLVWLLHRLIQDHPGRYLSSNCLRDAVCHAWFYTWMKEPLWHVNVAKVEDARLRQASNRPGIKQSDPVRKRIYRRPRWLDIAGAFEADYRAFPKAISKRNYALPPKLLRKYKETAQQLYADGVSSHVIAHLLNIGVLVVLEWLRDAGVDIRTR